MRIVKNLLKSEKVSVKWIRPQHVSFVERRIREDFYRRLLPFLIAEVGEVLLAVLPHVKDVPQRVRVVLGAN